MKFFADPQIFKSIYGSYVFLDNDFLSEAFYHEEVSSYLIDHSNNCYFVIDPLTEFEFLRDVFIPEQINLRRNFLDQPVFSQVTDHQDIYVKIIENAFLLSKIYAHQKQNSKISVVDIFLAARMMYLSRPCHLITGNKKDFPSSIFDIVGVFNIEQPDGQIKAISIVCFSREKFERCYADLQKVK